MITWWPSLCTKARKYPVGDPTYRRPSTQQSRAGLPAVPIFQGGQTGPLPRLLRFGMVASRSVPRTVVLAVLALWLRAALRVPGLVLVIENAHWRPRSFEQWWLDSEPDAILMSWFGHPAVASSPGAGWLLFWLRILSYSAVTMAYLGLGALLLRGVRGSRAATTVLMVLAGLTLLPFSGNVGEYPMPGQALPFVGRLFTNPREENWPLLLAALTITILVLVNTRAARVYARRPRPRRHDQAARAGLQPPPPDVAYRLDQADQGA